MLTSTVATGCWVGGRLCAPLPAPQPSERHPKALDTHRPTAHIQPATQLCSPTDKPTLLLWPRLPLLSWARPGTPGPSLLSSPPQGSPLTHRSALARPARTPPRLPVPKATQLRSASHPGFSISAHHPPPRALSTPQTLTSPGVCKCPEWGHCRPHTTWVLSAGHVVFNGIHVGNKEIESSPRTPGPGV